MTSAGLALVVKGLEERQGATIQVVGHLQ